MKDIQNIRFSFQISNADLTSHYFFKKKLKEIHIDVFNEFE